MPKTSRSLLDTSSLTREEAFSLFSQADRFRQSEKQLGYFLKAPRDGRNLVVAFLFFEPSTRTRMSFQMAAYKLGMGFLTLESLSATSLTKGETLGDTVLNVAAMGPDIIVVRYGESSELDRLLPTLKQPVINAGSGIAAHPTQALLDAYTILCERGQIEGERVLLVGDVRHSRVARSNFDLLRKLGAEVAVCGPAQFLPNHGEFPGILSFESLDKGLEWATVLMGLRIQFERHGDDKESLAAREYHTDFGVTVDRLKELAEEAIILHPGPINHGVEFTSEVLNDQRSRVLKQVHNGVLIRAALMARTLSLEEK